MLGNVNDLSNSKSCEISAEYIEHNIGWRGNMSADEIETALEGQQSYTYLITQDKEFTYVLFYIRPEDNRIARAKFHRTPDNQWFYRNGADNIVPNLKELFRKIMHITDSK
jgi:hypothetical protein